MVYWLSCIWNWQHTILIARSVDIILKSCNVIVLEKDDLNNFIDGCLEVLPSPRPAHQHSSIISDVYYLLADEYLKSSDNQLSYVTNV